MSVEKVVTKDDEYWQAMGIEYIPTGFIDGNASGYRAINATMRVREITSEWRGFPSRSAALAGTGVPSGQSIPESGVVQVQTTGTAVITAYECKVSRPRVNEADMWRVIVTQKWQALYINGTRSVGAPATAFTQDNPAPITQT